MNSRWARNGQRGGATIEWLGMGGVAVALVAAVGATAPTLGPSVRDGILTLICRVSAPVTGQDCPAPDAVLADGPPADEPPPEEPPGEDEPGEDEPPEEPPGEDEPGDDLPGDEPPGEDEPGEDEPGDDEPGDDEPGDEPPPDEPGEDEPGEEEPPGEDEPVPPEDIEQPGQDECIPRIEEGIDMADVEVLGWPYPFLGGRLGGMYWTFKEQRADGKWQVTPIWYGDASVMAGAIGSNAFAGLYGMDGQTWVVDTEEEADQILAEHRLRPYRHLPGAGVIAPLRAGVEVVDTVVDWGLGLFGLDSEDHGPPQSEYVDGGVIGGFELYPQDDFAPVPFNIAGLTGGATGHVWAGARVLANPGEGEMTYYVSLAGDLSGTGDLRIPRQTPAQVIGSVAPAGEVVLRLGLVQDMSTGQFTHIDVVAWGQGNLGLGGGGAAGGQQGNVRVGATELSGVRSVVHARLPLEALQPVDRENAIEWMQALTGATNPEEAQAALAQQELGDLFDTDALDLTLQNYTTDGHSGSANVRIGTPAVGVGFDPAYQRRTHELANAYFWDPEAGLVPWTDCHA